ncbi:tyrosine--tRNA ligase [Pseudodesulfovibrio piezophilus]|uniref:Tyrosine--tRNA ligase n=1 Tax=Pseudodesulfovibrio piezophilus (strain DSM 21447 / JCM 15486 / C1TLV30) TaxID=1322246 RepID=M1WKL5_PSEP2|nr:tyrosine--tRNA ligase [Pseudodesulfovibrio piezophilus]CCH49811.1 Tyrosyl-tRNA synthetase [Pseudodesulfovibrio piezophilus C1TLV30]
MNIYDELKWRGLVNQVSDEDKVREYLGQPGATMYCGFDPTAESLHIGNLVPLLCLARMKRAGHNPLFLMGGATGLIGDPSGKDKERDLSRMEDLEARAEKIKGQVRRFFERNTKERPDIVNNYEWTKDLTAIELLRDVGKYFTVNWMLQKESVKGRIGREEVGISYTEFSYMILQGYDFYHLFKTRNCRLQIGGGDQWGNITAGCELIRKRSALEDDTQEEAFALTFPLITTASGKKFGKSEKGAIYLNPDITSPYAFYQYFINTDDRDVIKFLKLFTFLDKEQIAVLEKEQEEAPHLRSAQKRLAEEVTRMIHGQPELDRVLAATEALFGKGELKSVDPSTLRAALESAPSRHYAPGDVPDIPQMLVDLKLVASKGQARKDIKGGGVYFNGNRVEDGQDVTDHDFIGGELLVIRKGKKNYGLITRG